MTLEDELVQWGRVARIETIGRATGPSVTVEVGYLEAPGGSLLVAAGDPDADWTRNLDAESRCRVRVGDRDWAAIATLVEGPDAATAIRDLILRYGTPAERLGRGPVYRLRPVDTEPRLPSGS